MVVICVRAVLKFAVMPSFAILLFVASCSHQDSRMKSQRLRQQARTSELRTSPGGLPSDVSAEPIYKSEYRNEVFGFSVVIPDGLEGKGSAEPMPQHGFLITLSEEEEIIISIEGSYNAPLWSSLDEAFKAISSIDRPKDSKLVGQGNSLLAGRPAKWFVIQYTSGKGIGSVRVKKQIITLRACPEPEVDVIYSLTLNTPETRFQEDNLILERLTQSWKDLEHCG